MTFSGQCPACRQSLALTEASLLAAPTEAAGQASSGGVGSQQPLYRCQCGVALVAKDLGGATEIAAQCSACSSRYVVDRSGAGEELPCRCGETVIVPTAILVEHTAEPSQPTTSVQEARPESSAPEPSPEPSQPPTAVMAAIEPEPAVTEPEPAVIEPVQLPIVAAPILHQIQPPADEVFEEASIVQPSAQQSTTLQPTVSLPIVAMPTLVQIQLPCKPLPPTADAVTSSEPEPVMAETPQLPIVAAPILHQIELPADEVFEEASIMPPSAPPPNVPLPIVAAPTLVQIEIPAKSSLPTVAAVQAAVQSPVQPIDTIEPESNAGMAVQLPIVALPILFQIEVPPPQDEFEPEEIEIPSASETPSASEDALETELPTDSSPSDSMTITCPGCGREYVVPRSEVGQTAECECGFVFVMRENIAALDSAFCSDLMPVQPLAIDRTGERKQQPIHDSAVVGAESRSAVSKPINHKTTPRFRYSWLAWMAAGVLVTTFAFRSLYRFRSPAPNESLASRTLPRPIVGPRPVSPEEPIELQPIDVQPEAPQLVDFESVETIAATAEPELVQQQPVGLSEFLGPIQTHFEGLRSKQVYNREVLYGFSEMVTRLDVAGVEFSVKDLFWLADCWEQLADRASNGELASKCYWQAAAALALSQSLESISAAEQAVAERRRNELTEKSKSNVRVAERESREDSAEVTNR